MWESRRLWLVGLMVLATSCAIFGKQSKRKHSPRPWEREAALIAVGAPLDQAYIWETCDAAPTEELKTYCNNGSCGDIKDPDFRAYCYAECKEVREPNLRQFCEFAYQPYGQHQGDCDPFPTSSPYKRVCEDWLAVGAAYAERTKGEQGGATTGGAGGEPAEACKGNGAETSGNSECCSGKSKPKRCPDRGQSCGYVCCTSGDGCN